MNDTIKLAEKLGLFSEHWTPKIIGEMNGQYVKVAKGLGELPWHDHAREDELFWAVAGRLAIQWRGEGDEASEVVLGPGEILIVPRGVTHRPIATEEVSLILIEPKATTHTGSVQSEMSVTIEDQIRL